MTLTCSQLTARAGALEIVATNSDNGPLPSMSIMNVALL